MLQTKEFFCLLHLQQILTEIPAWKDYILTMLVRMAFLPTIFMEYPEQQEAVQPFTSMPILAPPKEQVPAQRITTCPHTL